MRYYITPARMALIKKTIQLKYWWECGQNEMLCIAGGNLKWCNSSGKFLKVWQSLKTLNIELSCDPAISLRGVYPWKWKYMFMWKLVHECSIQAWLIITKKWKWLTDTCYTVDTSPAFSAPWRKPDTKGHLPSRRT